ncbi:MAG TPA: hypothetical protein VJW17_02805 [Pyrinomonadaceae bacterium]|nr:hypothetical protein [Pyrinomonadaceae bacterium]
MNNLVCLTASWRSGRARWVRSYSSAICKIRTYFLLYPPSLEYIVAFWGCLYAGVVGVPAYPLARNRHLGRVQAIPQTRRRDSHDDLNSPSAN